MVADVSEDVHADRREQQRHRATHCEPKHRRETKQRQDRRKRPSAEWQGLHGGDRRAFARQRAGHDAKAKRDVQPFAGRTAEGRYRGGEDGDRGPKKTTPWPHIPPHKSVDGSPRELLSVGLFRMARLSRFGERRGRGRPGGRGRKGACIASRHRRSAAEAGTACSRP